MVNIIIVTLILGCPLVAYLAWSISQHKGCHFHAWEEMADAVRPSMMHGGIPTGEVHEKCSQCGACRVNILSPEHGYWHGDAFFPENRGGLS